MTPTDWLRLAMALLGVGALVLMVMRLRLNPFLALLLAALLVGAGSDKSLLTVAAAFQAGLGKTLGDVAVVICLGVMVGKLLAESRGAEVLAKRMVEIFGAKRIGLCVMALSLVVGLTTWFPVGLILLIPILQTLTRETGRSYLQLAIPLLACLSVMHGLMPPHPGPVVAIGALKADPGRVALWAVVIGLPTAALAGPVFANRALRRINVPAPAMAFRPLEEGRRWPEFGLTLWTLLLPVVLILAGMVGRQVFPEANPARAITSLVGEPNIALVLTVLFAFWSLGFRCGFSRMEVLKYSEEAVCSVGMVVLIVGGGGGFARVLELAGAASAMAAFAKSVHLPLLVYAWLVTAFIRVATGSATVAITTAAGLMAPEMASHPAANRELMVIAMGCGGLFLSHLNDSGFWLVKECLGLTVGQTLRTWTMCETIVGLAGLALTLLASAFF